MDPAEHALHVGAADGHIFQVSLVRISTSATRLEERQKLQQALVPDTCQSHAEAPML